MGMGLTPGMRMLCPFPLVNMASLSGFFYPWLELGGTLLLHHPIDLPVFLAQISGERVAYTVAPPALLNMLLKQPGLLAAHDLWALRIVASGSAPLAPWMVRAFEEEHGIAVVNVFGSNEGVSLLSATDDVPDPAQRAVLFPRYGVPGLAWSNPIASRIGTRLVDPASGAVVDAPGVVAELQITGPNVMDGYLGAPAQDPAVFSADGWFRSGDLFEIAPEHPRFYRFAGRLKEIIVRGGMKISPEELDTLLAGHPDVAEVAVAGYACAILGERVGAAVVTRGERAPALADIGSYLEEQGVARIKWPERLICLHIDHGFMRHDESATVVKALSALGVPIEVLDANSTFACATTDIKGARTGELQHTVSPEEKRKIIGDTFMVVTQQLCEKKGLKAADVFLAQGTLRPDLIESASTLVSSNAECIKTHHNDTQLVRQLRDEGRVLEPLRDYHKDEVRVTLCRRAVLSTVDCV